MTHRCDGTCICPVHRAPLIYWPSGDQHACQDIRCQYGHGLVKSPLFDRGTPEAHMDYLDFYAQEAHLRDIDLAKLNSATKYPSIETYHLMDRGVLKDGPMHFDGKVTVTEKVDGTNSSLIALPTGDWFIGSRHELLYAKGDRVGNKFEGIVDALKPMADRLAHDNEFDGITVFYFETYGGKIGAAARQYSSTAQVGVRLFDVAFVDPAILDWEREKIAAWRDNGGQTFADEETLIEIAETKRVPLAPRLLTLNGDELPKDLPGTEAWLKQLLPQTQVHLDGTGGKAEGVVLRSHDRKTIAKARFEDYARTARKQTGGKR